MVLVEDDTILHPEIHEDCLFYVPNLNEGPNVYERFFDALLIKRDQHRAFYRDLRGFREQPQVIQTLQDAATDKKMYKEVTLIYLNSRFAHPWCRKTPMKKAYWRAEWGTIQGKQKDADTAREEERLHKLLVPIWIIMRSKMFPGDDVVKQWCTEERERQKQKREQRLTMAALKLHDEKIEKEPLRVPDTRLRTHSFDDDMDDEDEQRAAASAATSVFRLAAAGVILSQTPKRKLRWLTKKP